MSRVSHGLSRVMSRVALENRPVFVGLSRRHGSSRGRGRGSAVGWSWWFVPSPDAALSAFARKLPPPPRLSRTRRRDKRRTVPASRPYLGAEEEGGVPLPERRLCFTHPLARCQLALWAALPLVCSRTIRPMRPSTSPLLPLALLTDTSGTMRTLRSPTICISCMTV